MRKSFRGRTFYIPEFQKRKLGYCGSYNVLKEEMADPEQNIRLDSFQTYKKLVLPSPRNQKHHEAQQNRSCKVPMNTYPASWSHIFPHNDSNSRWTTVGHLPDFRWRRLCFLFDWFVKGNTSLGLSMRLRSDTWKFGRSFYSNIAISILNHDRQSHDSAAQDQFL
ncbi:hypothetical protein CC78DRAFT_583380 [Lojkania enalia]|uniref:Uncharacterized protein n=1 Tax=Lojkania enalia TaxID=147567 RepID=A0A9P4K2G8_9PLEO|nr:hypothetical protein CC78DRAFT_583380 [Didymosphaeria enalia]